MWAARGLIDGVRKSPRRVRSHYRICDREEFEGWLKDKWQLNRSYKFKRPARAQGEKEQDYLIRWSEAYEAWEKEHELKRREFMDRIFSPPRKS